MTFSVRITTSPAGVNRCFQIRKTVFVDEQNYPELLVNEPNDPIDETATHFLLFPAGKEDHLPNAIGVARMFVEAGDEKVATLGRIAVLKEARGGGAGRSLMDGIEVEARKQGFRVIKLHSQMVAKGFYDSLGYVSEGDVYFEAGTSHITMLKKLSTPKYKFATREAKTEAEKNRCFEIRLEGFSPVLEFDDLDAISQHFLLFRNQSTDENAVVDTSDITQAIGVARLYAYPPDPTIGKIGRVAVIKSSRMGGAGSGLMTALEEEGKRKGFRCLKLHAQVVAKRFYESCGYVCEGDEFDDEGAPHIMMVKFI